MKTKKLYLFLTITIILLLFFLVNKDVIFQEGNPTAVLKGIIQLNDTNTFVKIKDNPTTYVTKTNNNEDLFNYIEAQNGVKFKEHMGSGYMFEDTEKSVVLTSRQYTRFYQIWEFSEHIIINLNFTPIQTEVLKEGSPNENLIYEKSMSLGNLFGQGEIVIDLYYEKVMEESVKPNAAYAFLQCNDKVYELGNVSSYGLEDLKIEAADRTFDGKSEIEIVGGVGATYIQLQLIGYNAETNEFVNLLTMGSPEYVDLDRDGRDELLGVSAGVVPSYVDIFRWNGEHFEMADISKETNHFYVALQNENGIWYIEAGNFDENNKMVYTYFIYRDGMLIEH